MIGATEIAEMQVAKVTEVVKEKEFNACQIQEYCFSFSREELLNELKEKQIERYNQIYDVVFNKGIDVERLTRVIVLELRDKVLSSLNKPHEEIDQHSPD